MTQLRPAAAILATLGALGIGFSAYIDWLGERAPQDVPIRRLWDDDATLAASSYWRSLAIPLVIASVVGLVGILAGSRTLLAVSFVAAAVTLVWYLIRENDLRGEIDGADMPGAWVLMGSLVLLAAGTLALRSHGAAGQDRDTSHLVPRPGT